MCCRISFMISSLYPVTVTVIACFVDDHRRKYDGTKSAGFQVKLISQLYGCAWTTADVRSSDQQCSTLQCVFCSTTFIWDVRFSSCTWSRLGTSHRQFSSRVSNHREFKAFLFRVRVIWSPVSRWANLTGWIQILRATVSTYGDAEAPLCDELSCRYVCYLMTTAWFWREICRMNCQCTFSFLWMTFSQAKVVCDHAPRTACASSSLSLPIKIERNTQTLLRRA